MLKFLKIIICTGILSVSLSATADDKTILMWIQGEAGAKAFRELSVPFTELTGIDVQVRVVDDIVHEVDNVLNSTYYPDIILWANDRIHGWVKKNVITNIHPSQNIYDSILNVAWDYVSKKDKFYGYPLNIECVSLIYNKALIPMAPVNYEDIALMAQDVLKQNKYPIVWDYNNAYYTWGLLAANGGYIYKNSLGYIDPNDTGVNHPSLINAAKYITKLIHNKVVPSNVGEIKPLELFKEGNAAMIIDGPWTWEGIEKSNIDYGIALLPKYNGHTSKPMVGAKTLMMSKNSKHKNDVKVLIEHYFLSKKGFATLNNALNLTVVSHKITLKRDLQKTKINATFQNCQQGQPMPDIPEMHNFWATINQALPQIYLKNMDAEQVLNQAAADIIELNMKSR